MRKSTVILLVTIAALLSGCQNAEEKAETTVSSAAESLDEEDAEPAEDEVVEDTEPVEEKNTAADATETKKEETEDDTKENVYKAQMDLVYQALSEQWSIDKYFENDISALIANQYEGTPLDNVGYAFKDLDGDGKDELLISTVSKDASGGMLYDVYTAPNGEVVHLLSGHERNRYYLQWLEEGTYMIANEASNNAYNSAWYYYSIIEGKLELMQGVVFNAAEDENNPWFLTYDEDWDASNDTHDTDGTAEAIIQAYTNSYTILEYTPFSAYKN